MRTVVAWSDKVPDRDGVKSTCYDIAFNPDGTQLVTGMGSRVLVYDANDGDLLHSLKGHKDTVYCVSYASDGKRFASGGADKAVIIWTHRAEGILKYMHQDTIQCVAYNPVTQVLASATATDFGFWSPDQKSVAKHKVSGRVLSMSWTNDGQYLALGQFDGRVFICDKSGKETVTIQRPAPVWTLCWNPSRDEPQDILSVGCWDGTLSFYQLSGIQVGKDKDVGYDPCSVSYFSNGEYICVGGTNRQVGLVTKEGTRLTNISEHEAWVWSCKPRPKQNYVAVGCDDGTLTMYQLIFSTVHGLYQERYAYRDFMTDVIIQHLITEQKVRIKCRDYVKKIAVYKDRLAVQLPDRVIVYELNQDDAFDMHYRVSHKIQKKLTCNLLVVTTRNVILCQEKNLQLYGFDGVKEREWVLESVIRYIKVVGGPPGREGLLVGLKSGMILKIFVDNQFPIQLIKHPTSIRCLDLSASRGKLAVVDENTTVCVYSLLSKQMVFEERNANSVAWNTEFEEMLCFSGSGMLSIKTGDFPLHQQKLQGFVVGFKGSKIFCLHYISMKTIDVPQSASLKRYLDLKNYEAAYKVACLGVTEKDWRLLAMGALQGMSLRIARQAFIRVRDVRYIELLNRIEAGRKAGTPDTVFMAEILAHQGKYQEAAKEYAKAGKVEVAMEMFSDLRQFDEAKTWAEQYARARGGDNSSVQELIFKQAKWSEEVNDFEAAADMYLKAKHYDKAIRILGLNESAPKLLEVMRALGADQQPLVAQCAALFRKWGSHANAKEAYIKLGDVKSLMELHVELNKWDDAFLLLKSHPEFADVVYLPYAKDLALKDRFDEARLAYKRAGRPELSSQMLQQLCHNAVVENRFKDASFYFWTLAQEVLDSLPRKGAGNGLDVAAEFGLAELSQADAAKLSKFQALKDKACIYHAYDLVHRCVTQPFHTVDPATLLNASRYLTCLFNAPASRGLLPLGVSQAHVLYTMAKNGEALEAYKTARFAYNKLQTLKMPQSWHDEIDLACITTRAKPFSDAEEQLPVCYRCGTVNPLVNSQGDVCINCGATFLRSFVTFDHLPLVEFELEGGVSDQEAMELLEAVPPQDGVLQRVGGVHKGGGGGGNRGGGGKAGAKTMGGAGGGGGRDGFREQIHNENTQTLRFDDEEEDEPIDETLFSAVTHTDPFQAQMAIPHNPIRASRAILRSLDRSEVLVMEWPCACLPNQYFRIMDPELVIVMDQAGNFYEYDEYELATLEHGREPFTRAAVGKGIAHPREPGAAAAAAAMDEP